ncbi:MAG: DUF1015 domain-containing protein [Bacteroidota bacterium]|nr:DUF1015 domain-containing protein [Bacteroidota bacterium]MDP3146074.1 DUF1015 domain-containing protein [Bacteroidota bacterium]
MATVLPFKGLRPTNDKVHLVASRSVDGYNPGELKDKLSGNPFTFLHVINPDFEDGVRTKPGSKERLVKVKRRFKSFIKEKVLKRDEKPAYYIYRQIKNSIEFIGIIGCTSIDDYMNGVIKVHEQTITQREEKLKDYLEVCEFNAEPVLFCYPNDTVLDNLISEVSNTVPDYDFTTTDKVQHTLWVVSDSKKTDSIVKRFASIPSIYIADGHHRSASSALLGSLKRKAKKDYTGKEAFNFYLGVFFSETQLKIYDYNRVVKDLNNLSVVDLIQKLKNKFEVKEINQAIYKPEKKHEISMYVQGKWYSLMCKKGTYNSEDPVGSLDAFILTEEILSPILNIHDLKTDKRIGFIPGVKGAEALKKTVDEGKAAIAFGLYPVTMDHLKWIADTNNIMPPKSTWVEPKMRSGLVIYSFEDES